MVALRAVPVAAVSVSAAARLSSAYVARLESPAAEAIAVKRPGMPLATSGGEVASPFESVVAPACTPPRKLAPAPVEPGTIEKLTVAPWTGLPLASVTRACSGSP